MYEYQKFGETLIWQIATDTTEKYFQNNYILGSNLLFLWLLDNYDVIMR